jgi:type IV pilus assembly protein PilB
MVLSTVHTNDSPSAITRFVDMGVPPYLVTATFNLILSQRLVRRLCPKCRQKVKLTQKQITDYGLKGLFRAGALVYEPKGCKACNQTGYRGRFAVFEIMPIGEGVKEMVLKGASLFELRRAARRDGMVPLVEQALQKVREGETSLEEAIRLGSTEGTDFDELV